MGPLGASELIIIFIVALIVFGPRKLPELGRSLGKSLSEFKRASNELRNTLDEEIQAEDRRAALARPSESTASTPAPEPDPHDYQAPEDAYGYDPPPDSDPQTDDYRVASSEPAAADATPEAAAAAPEPAEPETVARGQHG